MSAGRAARILVGLQGHAKGATEQVEVVDIERAAIRNRNGRLLRKVTYYSFDNNTSNYYQVINGIN